MPQGPRCIESHGTDPYTNLAIESCLMRSVQPGEPILYLWQNERTVVIGRNQCASAECNLSQLERDGGHLARRRSGGGAVYHDLGNLNFTFVTTAKEYDQTAQTDVILDAVCALGFQAERTGRNDLVLEGGRKFSGHAYQHTGSASCHHGTIMVSVDVDALGRYLNVSPSKLQTKGIRSVRSRVTNLQAVRPDISVATLKEALRSAYAKYVGHAVEVEDASELDAAEVEAARQHFASREWLFRGERLFDESRKGRFAWGEARIDLTCDQGIICDLVVFSDGLDAERIDAIPKLLSGVPKRAEDVEERLLAGGFPTDMAVNIAQLIAN
ncbi:MAG: lipoate--protein ligase [Coriobacteriales bacterium]|nr:lipoate--protein ligase [Coriobacteriales bacterium]